MSTIDIAPAALAACGIPATYLAAGLFASKSRPFAVASAASFVAFGLGALSAGLSLSGTAAVGASELGLRLDLVTAVMLTLVTFVGLVIVRYSRTYLDGDPGRLHYSRWLMGTLAAVTVLISTAHIGVLAAAWTATSLALHQLLTFFKDRPEAQIAAHKKFLVSRLADLCLWGGIALIYGRVGSLWMVDVEAWLGTLGGASGATELPAPIALSAMLFVIAACLKSAQLPFHGWLTQVMEAPTPVSALLHAGVVNIGGFLMIRMAGLMALAPTAQLVLVIVGTTTTVLAALVMTTRVSVKVGLAWSTCAQMGLMLVQCGLGAWHLALLHLVGHSLYKAHAFLASGSTVEEWRELSLLPEKKPVRAVTILGGATAMVAVIAGGAWALRAALAHGADGSESSLATLTLAGISGLALVPMMVRAAAGGGARLAAALPKAGLVLLLSIGWHGLAGEAMVLPEMAATYLTGAWSIVGIAFLLLFAVQSALEVSPEGRLARWLHPWLFAGFYLDELFTRLTFGVWPPRPVEPEPPIALPTA